MMREEYPHVRMTKRIFEAVNTFANECRQKNEDGTFVCFSDSYNEFFDKLIADRIADRKELRALREELGELKRKIPEVTLKKLLENVDAKLEETEKRQLVLMCEERSPKMYVAKQTCDSCLTNPDLRRECKYKRLQVKEPQ